VIFWDTSAIAPLLVEEASSPSVRALMRADSETVVWWGLPVECLSALARRERAGDLTPVGGDQARAVLQALAGTWVEVAASESVRNHATRLLRRHPLRAADALALGAALVWSEGTPEQRQFASLDERLSAAARREGFRLALSMGASPG
jgi:uncharacterized protein